MSKKQKKNYFELLGMPSQFDLDLIELERQYLERIRLAHPDQRGDTQASSQLNQAYQALSNLLARAQHLLELRGGEMTETLQDKALLTQSLEGREKLAQAENSETLQALEKGAQTRVKEAQKVLTLSFEKDI
ncbi:MAG: hypothetical protein GY915_03050, partial [bacterium]|nr:hypothetical protein [bacterium]